MASGEGNTAPRPDRYSSRAASSGRSGLVAGGDRVEVGFDGSTFTGVKPAKPKAPEGKI